MEPNLPIAKKMWKIVRVVLFMIRKGISKRKLMVDLNMLLKRGKNLMFHHHHHHAHGGAPHSSGLREPPHEYEFSCSNTPTYSFPFHITSKKKHHHNLFACAHAPPTVDDDVAAVQAVLEMLNDGGENSTAADLLTAPSPNLPGFGRTPLAKPLRITDSPFPIREEDDGDNGHVDKAAEEFIQKFYKNLKLQKKMIDCN